MVDVRVKADDIDWKRGVVTKADTYLIAVKNVDTGETEAYQIDLGEIHYIEEVDPLLELLAKYGQRIEAPGMGIEPPQTPAIEPPTETPEPQKPARHKPIPEPLYSDPEKPQVPFTKEETPTAPVLAGTNRVDVVEAEDAKKNTGKLPRTVPSWVNGVRATCMYETPSGPCRGATGYRNRQQHAFIIHGLPSADVPWILSGIPEGESEGVCPDCGLNFPHPVSLMYHERACSKRVPVTVG